MIDLLHQGHHFGRHFLAQLLYLALLQTPHVGSHLLQRTQAASHHPYLQHDQAHQDGEGDQYIPPLKGAEFPFDGGVIFGDRDGQGVTAFFVTRHQHHQALMLRTLGGRQGVGPGRNRLHLQSMVP